MSADPYAAAPATQEELQVMQHLFGNASAAARERARVALLRDAWQRQRAAEPTTVQPSTRRSNFTRAIGRQMHEIAANEAYARALLSGERPQVGVMPIAGSAGDMGHEGELPVTTPSVSVERRRELGKDTPAEAALNEIAFDPTSWAERLMRETGGDKDVTRESVDRSGEDEV